MKHLLIALITALAIAACLVGGTCVMLSSTVEGMARDALDSMSALNGPRAELAVGSVNFSPLTRTLTIEGTRSRAETPRGPVTSSVERFSAVVPLRALLAQLPLVSSLLFSEDSVVTLLTGCVIDGPARSGGGLTLRSERTEIGRVRLTYPLYREYLIGGRPSFASAFGGITLEKIRFTRQSVTPDGGSGASLTAGSVEVDRLNSGLADRVVAEDIALESGGRRCAAARAELTGFRLPTALLVGEPAPEESGRAPLERALGSLTRDGAPQENLTVRGLALSDRNGPYLTAEELTAAWPAHIGRGDQSVLTLAARLLPQEAHVRGGRVPADALDRLCGLSLGLDGLDIEADLEAKGGATRAASGIVRAAGLCDARFSGVVRLSDLAFRDAAVTFKDYSLLARAVAAVTPDAHASAMLLKAAAMPLCAGDTEQDKASCGAIADFIDAPGSLTVATAKGQTTTPEAVMAAILSRRLGSVLEIGVQPGPLTLTRQVEGLAEKRRAGTGGGK